MGMKTAVLMACCCLAGVPIAHAAPLDLFTSIIHSGDGNSPPPPDAFAVYDTTLDIVGLAGMPDAVSARIPLAEGSIAATVRRESMARREGFMERDLRACIDGDPTGCEIIPVPGFPLDQFSYTWVGQGDDYDLRLTIHHGYAVGVLSGPQGRFEIRWNKLKELRQSYFHIDDNVPQPPPPWMPLQPASPLAQTQVPVMSPAAADAATYARIEPQAPSSATALDLLILITEEARIQAGGNPADCRDMAGVMAYVHQNLASINVAFQRSLIPASVGAISVARLTGYTLIPDDGWGTYARANLDSLQLSANIKALRNAVGADVVATVFDTQTHLGPCGVAYIQRADCGRDGGLSGCGSGALFSQYTHLLETIQCNVMDTFTHELGHVLGAEHDRQNTSASATTASFPYSFGSGYGSGVPDGFETIMSQRGFQLPQYFPVRLLQFSNPNVLYHGRPTGVAVGETGQAYNALTLANLLPGTAAFRTRPNRIFASGFDETITCPGVVY